MGGMGIWADHKQRKGKAAPLEITDVVVRPVKSSSTPTIAMMDVTFNNAITVFGFRVWQRYPDLPDRITIHAPEDRRGAEVVRGINDSQESALHVALRLAYIQAQKT